MTDKHIFLYNAHTLIFVRLFTNEKFLLNRTLIIFMPNKANAKKALRQAKKHMALNLDVKRSYKSAIKSAKAAFGSADMKEKLRIAQKQIDKAAKRGVIKAGAASRKLSRLMKKAGS